MSFGQWGNFVLSGRVQSSFFGGWSPSNLRGPGHSSCGARQNFQKRPDLVRSKTPWLPVVSLQRRPHVPSSDQSAIVHIGIPCWVWVFPVMCGFYTTLPVSEKRWVLEVFICILLGALFADVFCKCEWVYHYTVHARKVVRE